MYSSDINIAKEMLLLHYPWHLSNFEYVALMIRFLCILQPPPGKFSCDSIGYERLM